LASFSHFLMVEALGFSAAAVGVVTLSAVVQRAGPYLSDEKRLPKHVAIKDDSAVISVLAVHVCSVEMASCHQGARFVILAKYGSPGDSLRCEVAKFSPASVSRRKISHLIRQRPASGASASIDSTCLFLQSAPVDPVIRLSVREARPWSRSLARGSIPLANLKASGKFDVPLLGKSDREVGRVSIACEALSIRRQDLARVLACAGAIEQRDAYLISGVVPTIAGVVVDDGDISDTEDIAIGVPS